MASNDALAVRERESTAVVDRGWLSSQDVLARTTRILEIQKAVMKPKVHFGVIPGTQKETLYKPGAEKLLMTFQIGAKVIETEDLSVPGEEVKYRLVVGAFAQTSGELLGQAIGICSSSEEKYRWRKPVCDEEWAEAPEDQRRSVWKRYDGKPYKAKQVRTSPADVENTVVQMAYKRGLVMVTRVVLACSDIFDQDLEDMPDELRESIVEQEAERRPVQQPQRVAPATPTTSALPQQPTPTPPPEPARTGNGTAAFDPAQPYTVKKVWQPNPSKGYRFLELMGAGGTFTVHTWDEAVMALCEQSVGKLVRVSGQPKEFQQAPFQVKKAEIV